MSPSFSLKSAFTTSNDKSIFASFKKAMFLSQRRYQESIFVLFFFRWLFLPVHSAWLERRRWLIAARHVIFGTNGFGEGKPLINPRAEIERTWWWSDNLNINLQRWDNLHKWLWWGFWVKASMTSMQCPWNSKRLDVRTERKLMLKNGHRTLR